ncbi:MAG: hypothetical protein ACM3QX_18450 [Syntrophomonadaceae bacterium]
MADLIKREDTNGSLQRQDFITSLVSNLEQKKQVAEIMLKSGFMPPSYNTWEKLMVTMFKCQELNIPLMEGVSSIAIINNKPTMQGNLLLALINRSGKCKKMVFDSTDTYCTVTMARKDYELEHTEKFTLKDAQAAGLTSKDIWKKYTKTMLKWRAVANCARTVFPELLSGLYLPEEIASIDNTPVVVDEVGNVEIIETTPPAVKPNARSAYYDAITSDPVEPVKTPEPEAVEEPKTVETPAPTMPEIPKEEPKAVQVDSDVVSMIAKAATTDELLELFNRIPNDKKNLYLKYLSQRKAEIKDLVRNGEKKCQEIMQQIQSIDNAADYWTQEAALLQKIQMSGASLETRQKLFRALEEKGEKWNVSA